jgi:hypothetical protein
VPGGCALCDAVRDAAAGSLTTPRVSLVEPRTSTRPDVAPVSAGVRDVRLAWSDVHNLFATMLMPSAPGDGLGTGAFLASGASGFGPVERVTSGESVQELAPDFVRDASPHVVWSASPDGTDPGVPVDSWRRVMRTSTRTG